MSRSVRATAIGVVLFLQLVGLGVLLVGLATRWGFCLEADSSTCSDSEPVTGAIAVAVAVGVLLGAFVMGALIAGPAKPIRTGLAFGAAAWAGGALLTAITGSRPLVGVVFGVGTAMVLVAPERRRPAAVLGLTTGVVALLEVSSRNAVNGLPAISGLVAVAFTVLAPAD